MEVKKYVMRSVHYVLKMVVILGLAFWVLHLTDMLDTGGEPLWKALFMGPKGGILLAAVILLAGLYPRWGFGVVTFTGDMQEDKGSIVKAMDEAGYVPTIMERDKMVFRAKSIAKRALKSFDDAITLTAEGDQIAVEGQRKEIVRVEARVNAYRGGKKEE